MAVAAHATFQPLGPVAGGLSSFSSDAEAGISRKTAVDARKVRQLIESLDIEGTLVTCFLGIRTQMPPSSLFFLFCGSFSRAPHCVHARDGKAQGDPSH